LYRLIPCNSSLLESSRPQIAAKLITREAPGTRERTILITGRDLADVLLCGNRRTPAARTVGSFASKGAQGAVCYDRREVGSEKGWRK